MSVYQRSPRNINIWYCLMVDGQVTLWNVIVHIGKTSSFSEFLSLHYVNIIFMASPASGKPKELSSLGVPLGTIRIFIPLNCSCPSVCVTAASLCIFLLEHIFFLKILPSDVPSNLLPLSVILICFFIFSLWRYMWTMRPN